MTLMMLQSNPVKVIDTSDRSEAWLVKDGNLHALLLSCPIDRKGDMQAFIDTVQKSEQESDGAKR
jgi:hypothetical protein